MGVIPKSFYLLPIFFAFALTTALFLVYKAPVGEDVHFHLQIAEVWARGENGAFSQLAMQVNKLPYPPLLHWLLVPSVWLGIENLYAAFLQIFLLPFAVGSFMFLLWKTTGKEAGFLGGFLVLGSYAFVDRAMQVNPQALDMILLPLVFYGFVKKKALIYNLNCLLLVLSHGIVALPLVGGLLVWNLWQHKDRAVPWLFLIGASPVIVAQLAYLPQALVRMGSGFENLQEQQFWTSPVTFMILYQRLIFLGFILIMVKIDLSVKRKVNYSELEKICLASLATMFLLIPVWADRFVQYSTIPLGLLLTIQMIRLKPIWKEAWKFALLIAFVLMYATLWIWLMANSYFVS